MSKLYKDKSKWYKAWESLFRAPRGCVKLAFEKNKELIDRIRERDKNDK